MAHTSFHISKKWSVSVGNQSQLDEALCTSCGMPFADNVILTNHVVESHVPLDGDRKKVLCRCTKIEDNVHCALCLSGGRLQEGHEKACEFLYECPKFKSLFPHLHAEAKPCFARCLEVKLNEMISSSIVSGDAGNMITPTQQRIIQKATIFRENDAIAHRHPTIMGVMVAATSKTFLKDGDRIVEMLHVSEKAKLPN